MRARRRLALIVAAASCSHQTSIQVASQPLCDCDCWIGFPLNEAGPVVPPTTGPDAATESHSIGRLPQD